MLISKTLLRSTCTSGVIDLFPKCFASSSCKCLILRKDDVLVCLSRVVTVAEGNGVRLTGPIGPN